MHLLCIHNILYALNFCFGHQSSLSGFKCKNDTRSSTVFVHSEVSFVFVYISYYLFTRRFIAGCFGSQIKESDCPIFTTRKECGGLIWNNSNLKQSKTTRYRDYEILKYLIICLVKFHHYFLNQLDFYETRPNNWSLVHVLKVFLTDLERHTHTVKSFFMLGLN